MMKIYLIRHGQTISTASFTKDQKYPDPDLDEITECVENVAVVTHGGVIMVLLSAILGMGLENRFRFFPIENCSINTLIYDQRDQSMKVLQVNDIAHIELGK